MKKTIKYMLATVTLTFWAKILSHMALCAIFDSYVNPSCSDMFAIFVFGVFGMYATFKIGEEI